MTTDNQPEIILDYAARDFQSVRAMLVGIARGLFPEWTTVGEANDFGTLLLELYAYMGDTTNFYIDRVSSEAFLGTAQRRQSVLYIAEMLGYKPLPQFAATTLLKFTLSTDYPTLEPIEIPSGTVVQTRSDYEGDTVYFETDYAVSVERGQEVTVTATEGRTNTQFLGASRGVPNAGYLTDHPGVIGGTVRVRTLEGFNTVGGGIEVSPVYVDWNEVASVAGSRPGQSVFSTMLGDDNYTVVVFGDNAAGRIVPVGSDIEITYRYGTGSLANRVTANDVSVISAEASLSSFLSVRNIEPARGGSDVESVESMKWSIPQSRQVRYRGVTLSDFQALALQVPGVSKAIAYGEIYSSINLRIAPSQLDILEDPVRMSLLREQVNEYLSDKMMVGAEAYVEDVQWQDVYIAIEVTVLDGFSRENTVGGVFSSIFDTFDYPKLDFGQGVSLGEVFRAALRVQGVDHIDITAYNTNSVEDSATINRITPSFDRIIRIHPAGDDPETDPIGLKVTGHGGVT